MTRRGGLLLCAGMFAGSFMATSCVRFAVVEQGFELIECPSAEAFPADFKKGEFELEALRGGKTCPGKKHYTLLLRQEGGRIQADSRLDLRWTRHSKGCDLRASLQIPCERSRALAECMSRTASGAKGGGGVPTVGESKERFFRSILPAFLREGAHLSLKDATHHEVQPVVSVRETDKPLADTCD